MIISKKVKHYHIRTTFFSFFDLSFRPSHSLFSFLVRAYDCRKMLSLPSFYRNLKFVSLWFAIVKGNGLDIPTFKIKTSYILGLDTSN